MSGGRVVIVDRAGRDGKAFPLEAGLATLGSDPACDITVLLPAVRRHHATLSVHAAQTVLRTVGGGYTLLNGAPVSVAALRHGDLITLGDRQLRWEYSDPTGKRQPGGGGESAALAWVGGGGGARGARRVTAAGGAGARDRDLQLALELRHRASMPASSGGKQVAVVQPQRRDTSAAERTARSPDNPPEQPSDPAGPLEASPAEPEDALVRRTGPHSHSTVASQWVHARRRYKTYNSMSVPSAPGSLFRGRSQCDGEVGRGARGRGGGAGRGRRARSAGTPRPVKIQPPLTIDHTKQAAIMLMTGHTKSKPSSAKSPSYVVKKSSPARKSPANKGRRSVASRRTRNTGDAGAPPHRRGNTSRNADTTTGNRSVSILDITESDSRQSRMSTRSSRSAYKSPLPTPTPKKSAMRDRTKITTRKTESIKFDLSNLDSQQRSGDDTNVTDDDITLRYSESSGPPSPSPRKSLRGSTLRGDSSSSLYTRAGSANSTVASAFRTRTLSPRKATESYSIVDLVSLDSNDTADLTKSAYDSTVSKSVYNSAGSADSTDFGTPHSGGRRTRSTIDPTLLGSSTPYGDTGRPRDVTAQTATRSKSSASPSTPRTPRTPHISVDSSPSPRTPRRTRPARARLGDVTAPADGTLTPVLHMRSFLDDSGSSRATPDEGATRRRPLHYNRKTIGVISEPRTRAKTRGKSLNLSAEKTVLRSNRESSDTSDRTDEGAPRPEPDPEDLVTPTSAVKLVPEAVKNRHSTAKKPQSKRSIIDTLNRSDMVKQLFNSPVKRKLSRSMTEFSRKHSLAEEGRPRRLLRHTVGAVGGSSPLPDRSDSYTPERFVSPVHSPAHSPDFTGVERLFPENTPEKEPSRDFGVQRVVRPPRARRSIKNDLTNVAGVKAVFGRSPRNNLTRVSGVKALLRNRSPRNDLSDVKGVKRLFDDRSPANDLTNVSGVKRTFRHPPRNDLSDVRGVRKMFKNQKRREQTSDVSGIEELFDDSSPSVRDPEILFDRLVGKPVIKAVYSKSFIKKKPKKSTRRNRSLHTPIDLITTNVEEWLQQELQKCLHKDESKVSKELQRLATDTVDGERPIVLDRTRNSCMKKSASEIYGAHTLPIKKRSLVETSMDMRGHNILPIKKRAVVHSTPVKGQVDLTMNGSELGRVSPISAFDHTNQPTRSTRLLPPKEKKAPLSRAIKNKRESPKKDQTPKSSPKKSTEKVSPKRSTRARTTQTNEGNKRRASLVITKKGPVMAPKLPDNKPPSPKRTRSVRSTRANKDNITPNKTRTKTNKAAVVETEPSPQLKPRRGNKRTAAPTSNVPEHSPTNTRTTRTNKNITKAKAEPSPIRGRKTRTTANYSKPKSALKKDENLTDTDKTKRGRKTVTINDKATQQEVVEATGRATRGRRTKAVEANVAQRDDETRQDKTPAEVKGKTTRRNKNTEPLVVDEIEKQTRTRSKIVPKQTEAPAQESRPIAKRRKVESKESVQSEPSTRSRRTKVDKVENDTVAETKTRKRKSTAIDEVPKKLAKTDVEQKPASRRANKNVTDEGVPKKQAQTDVKPKASVTKGSKTVRFSDANKTVRSTRKKAEEVTPPQNVARPVRGRKGAESKENISQQVNNKRKRNTSVTKSSLQLSEAVPSPTVSRTRSARGKPLAEVGVKSTTTTGRARRR